MRNIQINRQQINIETLDQALREIIGDELIGISANSDGVIVHVKNTVTNDADVRRIVQEHNASELSVRQQRKASVETARAEQNDVLQLADFDADTASVQALARKVRWLELELRELRGIE